MKVEKISSEEPQKTGLEEKQHSNSILLLKNKDLNRNLSPSSVVAGAAGFEPTNVGTKSRCLTTWRRPNLFVVGSQLANKDISKIKKI